MKLQDFDFRIWDNIEKKYINEIELHKYEKCPIEAGITFTETDRISEVEFVKNKNDLYIELCSGLYDKNGKKIYANDILNIDAKPFVFKDVIIADMIGGLFLEKNAMFLFNVVKSIYMGAVLPEVEIIGNIHENAELIKC